MKTTERESIEAPEPGTTDPKTPAKHRNPVLQFLGELPGLIIMVFVMLNTIMAAMMSFITLTCRLKSPTVLL